jgi:hypothetical protein
VENPGFPRGCARLPWLGRAVSGDRIIELRQVGDGGRGDERGDDGTRVERERD